MLHNINYSDETLLNFQMKKSQFWHHLIVDIAEKIPYLTIA